MELTHYVGIAAVLILFYYYLTWNFDYWKRRGVPQIEGPIPGFGHVASVILLQKSMTDKFEQLYESAPQYSMVGIYFGRDPCLLIRDPEVAKEVLVGNFSNFSRNASESTGLLEPMFEKNPAFTFGQQWKSSRSLLLSMFTGTRIKLLSNLVHKMCEKLSEYTDRKIAENHGVFEPELKDFCSRLTGEIYAVSGLGTEGYCFDDSPPPNSIREVESLIFGDNFWSHLRLALFTTMPGFCKLFGIKFFPPKFRLFFRKIAESTVKSWIKEKHAETAFLQIMLEHEQEETKNEEELVQALMMHMMTFFIDTFETTSVTMSFVLFHLSRHPEAQQKLRQEIESVMTKNNGSISMNDLGNMTYMTQVIHESMRLNTPLSFFMKLCTGKTKLTGSDGLSVTLDTGDLVIISSHAIHKDPKYWSEPDKFQPERFKTEHDADRHKFTFLPFGEGPRVCPGKRFAQMVIRIALTELLSKYSFEPSSKVRLPLEYSPVAFLAYVKGGLWAKIKRLPTKTINAKT